MQRLKAGEAADDEPTVAEDLVSPRARRRGRPRATRRSTASASRASRTSRCGWPSAAGRCRATRSSATSRSAAASRSTARTARTPQALRKDPERFVRSAGTATPRPRSRSSCRSTAGTATGCSRTSRGRSPRPASTSSRRAASSPTRWSRTASSSRSATRRRSRRRSRACARSTPSSTPTASRRRRLSRRALRRSGQHAQGAGADGEDRLLVLPDVVAVDLHGDRAVVARADAQAVEAVERVRLAVAADLRARLESRR